MYTAAGNRPNLAHSALRKGGYIRHAVSGPGPLQIHRAVETAAKRGPAHWREAGDKMEDLWIRRQEKKGLVRA